MQFRDRGHAPRPNVASWEGGLPPDAIVIIYAARSSGLMLAAASEYNLGGKTSRGCRFRWLMSSTDIRSYGFNDGEQALAAALLVTVNIAFPFKETDVSVTGTALSVLQRMAKKGNKAREEPPAEIIYGPWLPAGNAKDI
ncbi:hypothetical protein DL765_001993 [Monosporascus sp. GIB2]|nr:hypothetical protein DL765_001993 [Monosporascus sp. GIB2]